MNIMIKHSLFFVIIAVVFTSCKTMYRPNLVQAPVFKEKNNLQTDVLIGSNGGNAQIGYSVSENWAIVADGVYDVSKTTFMDTLYNMKDENSNYANYSGEIGFGYYKWLGKDSTYCFSLYGGGGYGFTKGYSDIWYMPDFTSYRSNYYKIFWQPGIAISKQYIDIIFVPRFRLLSYTKLADGKGVNYNTGVDAFIEPTVAFKVGGDQFKLHFQLGTSLPFQSQQYYTAGKLLFSVGFHLNIKKVEKSEYSFD